MRWFSGWLRTTQLPLFACGRQQTRETSSSRQGRSQISMSSLSSFSGHVEHAGHALVSTGSSSATSIPSADRAGKGLRANWLLQLFQRMQRLHRVWLESGRWYEPRLHEGSKEWDAHERPMNWLDGPAITSPRIHAAAMAAVQVYQAQCAQEKGAQAGQGQDRWSQVFAAYYSGDIAEITVQQSDQGRIPAALRMRRQQRWGEIDGLLTGLRAGDGVTR